MAHLGLKDTEEAAAAVEKDRAEHTRGKLRAHMWVPILGLPYGHILADQSRAPNSNRKRKFDKKILKAASPAVVQVDSIDKACSVRPSSSASSHRL